MDNRSCPDVGNPVQDISTVIDSAAYGYKKELSNLLDFVANNGSKGLKIEPTDENIWNIEKLFDSDFGGDNNGRRSITGFFIIVFIIPTSWKFKSQGNITLSSTEAEYVATKKDFGSKYQAY